MTSKKTIPRKNKKVLFECGTAFPIAQTKIRVTPKRIDIIKNQFMGKSKTLPILIEDLAHVRVTRSMFFSTIKFVLISIDKPIPPIANIKPADAKKLEDVIMGLIEKRKTNSK